MALRNETIYQPISLGSTCETKFQICRRLAPILPRPMSEMSFRLHLVPPERGARTFGWDVFDYWGVSFDAVREFIRRDFKGVYEREDLTPGFYEVLHTRFEGVNYIHDFDDQGRNTMTNEFIDRMYANAKGRFEARARAFQRHLETPGDFLYVTCFQDFPDAAAVQDAIGLLTERSTGRNIHFLFYGSETETSEMVELEAAGLVTKIQRASHSGKPATREFEGNDAAWDIGFDQFKLALRPRAGL